MPFDLDSMTFHLSKFESEIVDLTKDLDPIRYSALMGTIGRMYHDKKDSFTDSKRMAWEIFQLIKGVTTGTFPPPLEKANDVGNQDRIPPESQLVPGVFDESTPPGRPPLHGGDESRPHQDHLG